MSVYYRATTRRRIGRASIERTARALLRAAGEEGASVSLSFVGDAAIRRLNRDHRGRDRPTDVLSFPLFERRDLGAARAGDAERMLGDIVISVDTAARQARDYGAALRAEIDRLLIHGLLHLLGHDHERPAERRRMVAEERRLAAAIGLAWPYEAPAPKRSRSRGTRTPS